MHCFVKKFACWLLLPALAGCAMPLPRDAPEPPPETRKIDGCSFAPDFDFAACCDAHDEVYWRGGSCEQRLAADRALRACIAASGRPILAKVYYSAVRLGGAPWWPLPWRWGFGWPYGTAYSAACE